ncbi:rho guanine nucleotide exchange factor 10 isoform X2 [Pleurodeles waltl]|uniref:rho guanine nucleotide exchange factor 10 isoform X2 n=1 Tax=Pleurodeles waltl TaxID=8319 RepID=UPI0037098B84
MLGTFLDSMDLIDTDEFPPPPPEVLESDFNQCHADEDEGEQFEFDSDDDVPEADRKPSTPPADNHRSDLECKNNSNAAAVKTEGTRNKVNPYSVIDISPLQETDENSPQELNCQDESTCPRVPSGYSVPVPCGYAVPSNLPLILPTYSTPVIIRNVSVDEEGTQELAADSHFNFEGLDDPPSREDIQVKGEENILAKWVADPANTEWMETPDEVIYDDVPRENSGSTTDPEEMIYDDVENGEEGGNSSLECGWSSSEFESYEEQSDSECKHGAPISFLRISNKRHMQRLMKAAKEGTKDGLEKTRAAVQKGRSYIRTKSFIPHDRKSTCLEDEEMNVFIDVDCMHTEAIMTPMPDGLSQQQVVRRYILGSIVESEKNYVDALKRILEEYERPLSEMEPKLLSERKLKMVFNRIKEILQCHSLFQIALASRVSEWDSVEMIGDVFVASFSKSMVLDAYSEYVNNFSTAVAVLRKSCATKPQFLEFLKQCQESSIDRITLYGLMMKPIQRFPQFILLLQDMLKHTTKGHPDRLPLQMALTELETLAEKLNERKRDADQRCEIKQIAKAINERYLNKLLSSENRYIIRSDDMLETVYGERGEIIKTKERRLFMLNDVLMCATVNTRCYSDGSSRASTGQRYLLKWSVPLSQVEVIEYGSNEEQGESSRFPPEHAAEQVIVHAKANKLYMGPGQLYQDLQNLLHDLEVVGHISQLIGHLKGNYQNLNHTVAQDWTLGLQKLILKKEDEIRAADRCRIQLRLPGKPDKSGRPTFFTGVFNTCSPGSKHSWINNLQMAKLALEEDNQCGWFCIEDDGNQIRKEKHPLLLGHMAVMMSKHQEFKIECAVYNPEPYLSCDVKPDSLSMDHGFLWICSCTNQMGQIAIVSLQNCSPKVIECFNVESRILSMVYIPEERNHELEDALESENVNNSDVSTICLGMEEGSISVYKSSQGSKKVRLQYFFTPDKSTVMSLAYLSGHIYAGLVNGNMAIYAKAEDGLWQSETPKLIQLGVLPVRTMLVMEDTVWASSGGQIFIISTETHTAERQFDAHHEEGMVISHMVVVGVGIWIAFTSGSALRLFHTETLEHLQDVNIAAPVHHMLTGHQRVSVTSLLVCHGLLLVGTNLGIIVALPVPRLQGIPKVTGRGMVSYHAHNGPVKFLAMATPVGKKTRRKSSNNMMENSVSKDEEQKDSYVQQNERPLSVSTGKDDSAVWLSGSVCSIQKSDLSSSSSSLTSSHVSNPLEIGPEDGTVYELLNDPSISVQKSKQHRSKKMSGGSVIVISGGQGHRKVNKKLKPQRQEEQVSSVMVWQIPLLHV